MILTATHVSYSYLSDLVGHLSSLSHLRATQLCSEALDEIGLTPKQCVAIEFIAANGDVSQRDIATHIGTTPTVLVSVLDVLSERGFVERVRSTVDRRRHSVVLTDAGRAIRPKIQTALATVEQHLQAESGLDADEWQTLITLMQKLTHREPAP